MLFNTTKIPFDNLNGSTQNYLTNVKYKCDNSHDQAYLINLDRSTDRLEKSSNQLDKANFNYQRFPAVDGYKLEIKSLSTGKIVTGQQLKDTTVKTLSAEYELSYNHPTVGKFSLLFQGSLSAGELGVLASHVAIWRDAKHKGYNNIIIFEDDVIIENHEKFNDQVDEFICNIPSDFDVAFMDYQQVEGDRYEIPGNELVSAVSSDFMAWGTHATLYSKNGIEKLSHYDTSYKIFNEAVDIFIWNQASYTDPKGLVIYVSEVHMADVANTDVYSVSSTINAMGRYDYFTFNNETHNSASVNEAYIYDSIYF